MQPAAPDTVALERARCLSKAHATLVDAALRSCDMRELVAQDEFWKGEFELFGRVLAFPKPLTASPKPCYAVLGARTSAASPSEAHVFVCIAYSSSVVRHVDVAQRSDGLLSALVAYTKACAVNADRNGPSFEARDVASSVRHTLRALASARACGAHADRTWCVRDDARARAERALEAGPVRSLLFVPDRGLLLAPERVQGALGAADEPNVDFDALARACAPLTDWTRPSGAAAAGALDPSVALRAPQAPPQAAPPPPPPRPPPERAAAAPSKRRAPPARPGEPKASSSSREDDDGEDSSSSAKDDDDDVAASSSTNDDDDDDDDCSSSSSLDDDDDDDDDDESSDEASLKDAAADDDDRDHPRAAKRLRSSSDASPGESTATQRARLVERSPSMACLFERLADELQSVQRTVRALASCARARDPRPLDDDDDDDGGQAHDDGARASGTGARA
jgi:hypothetical protein